jgi:amino acid transporter
LIRGVLDILLGRRLANREHRERKIGAFEGVPAMGLDGLGSSSYGPEAALTVLMPLGAASVAYVGWVMAPIVALLLILFASYWQTIRAYPNNGGAYVVSRENLGTNAGLLAAAALMIDYVLNVAVGISAGVAALVSAVPALHPYILAICLGILLVITLANLRGTLDAGRLFALPTYLFAASFAVILVIGIARSMASGGHPKPLIPPPHVPAAATTVTLWLLLRAFAAGCTAMTGVEAVSNGMTAFKDPTVKYGHRTLSAIVGILGMLLAGIAFLVGRYDIAAMDQTRAGYQSVLSQLAHAVVGNGVFYYIAMGSLLCVLALSADTSFVGFPRLCRAIAGDRFLPKSFAIAGRRLVFTVGILYLAVTAGVLLVAFGGITDRLIPLFAIGAFLTFTLSQAGMVLHWRRELQKSRSARHRLQLWINATGAMTTGTALIIIVITKFREGAWITVLAMPLVIGMLRAIRAYYDELQRRIRDPLPLKLDDTRPPIVIVATESWNKLTDKAMRFALSLSPDVYAVHLVQLTGPEAEEHDRNLRAQWRTDVELPARAAGVRPPQLIVLQAEYRNMHEPMLELVRELGKSSGGRRIAVLLPEIARQHWYQHLLHTFRPLRLRTRLLKAGEPLLVIIDVPWSLDETDIPAPVNAEALGNFSPDSPARRDRHERPRPRPASGAP